MKKANPTKSYLAFKEDIYGVETRIVVAATMEEAQQKIELPAFTSGDDHTGLTTWLYNKSLERPINCIWLKKFDKNSATDVACLSHECLHAAVNTFQLVGIEFNYEYQEALNYYHMYIFRKALMAFGLDH